MSARGHCILSHGFESGPEATKVTALAEAAERLGWSHERPDYTDLDGRREVSPLGDVAARFDATTAQTTALHDTVTGAVDRQLQALAAGFDASTAGVAERWQAALDAQQAAQAALTADLRSTLDGGGEIYLVRLDPAD